MDFSIIIPVFKDWSRLAKCLAPLLEPATDSPEVEVIVVDNAVVHDPPLEIASLKGIKLVHEPLPGSYAARNKGAQCAQGRFLAFTDSDCIPEADWIQQGLAVFEKTGADLIGGSVKLFRENGGGEWAYIYEENMSFRQEQNVAKGHSVTANLMVRKVVFDALGGFDREIKSGGDFEFCSRATGQGYLLVYGGNVAVKHPARKTVRNLFKKQKRLAAWGYINVRNQYGHSGFRIFSSHVYNGFKSIFRKSLVPNGLREKMVVFWISTGLYLYQILLLLLIMMHVVDPVKIRL